jgi:hypothetical protein
MCANMRLIAALLLAIAVPAAAEESTKDWLKRILDPVPLGVVPFEGSVVNKKISVDTIRYETDPAKRIVVYTVPVARIGAAAAHFETTLGVAPEKDTDSKGVERYRFTVTGEGEQPPKAKGLTVTIFRSPWVDDMAQIQMELVPPE